MAYNTLLHAIYAILHALSVCDQPPGQLSLAIPSWVWVQWAPAKGRWCLAAGEWRQVWFVCGWQVKLVTRGPYLSAIEKGLIHKALYNFSCLLLLFLIFFCLSVFSFTWYDIMVNMYIFLYSTNQLMTVWRHDWGVIGNFVPCLYRAAHIAII